jgi:hypothetical protein
MKNRIILAVLLLGVMALFSSCLLDLILSTPQNFKIDLDERSSADSNFTLTYEASIRLKRWNGSDVTKTIYDGKRSIGTNDKIILSVPAGNTRFLFDVYMIFENTFSYTSYRVPDIEVSYSLEAGKKYQLKTRTKGKQFFL